jgi:predicted small lipoprotein YifL
MGKNSLIVSVAALSLLFLTACGEKIPLKEMARAKTAITKAEKVHAQKYAPEELELAKDSLFGCHDEILKNDMKKTQEKALIARKHAEAAYDKSAPLLAKDTIEIA